ncbi:hypothetical protein ACPA9J_31515 [Pseudomonas aeruginosa]
MLYRTGDLARAGWPTRNLECLGRADDQVKIRGNRVEPDEVRAPPRRASRRTRRRGRGSDSAVRGTHLVGYFVAAAELDPVNCAPDFRRRCRTSCCQPSSCASDSLPPSANGEARPPATAGTAGTGGGGCAAHGDRGRTGGGVGRCPRRGGGRRARRLYALGGDSILIHASAPAAQRRGLGLNSPTLMRNPTVAGLAERLVRPLAEEATSPLNWFPRSTSRAWKGWRRRLPDQPAQARPLFHSRQRPDSSVSTTTCSTTAST